MNKDNSTGKIVSFFGEHSVIFNELNQKASDYAASKGIEYRWEPQKPFNRQKVVGHLMEADAGIIDIEPYGEDIFKEIAGYTGLLVRFGVGYDKVDLEAASRYGIAIARTTGANTLGVAEMALTLLLNAGRKININRKCVISGNWDKNVAHEIINGTVGIVGFGPIGRAFASLISGFNCRILVYDPYIDKKIIKEKGAEYAEMDKLFSESDAISLHLPYNKDTHRLVNARMLSLMKPDAVIVNTSRGNIIDEQALFECLKDGKIGGAGLDVFAVEPLPPESPLLTLDNIILTPHISSQTVESLWRIYEMAVDIAADFLNGKNTPHILNPDYIQNAKIRAR